VHALVVELVDTADSKSAASRRAGSIPARGTIHANRIFKKTRQCLHGAAGFFYVDFMLNSDLRMTTSGKKSSDLTVYRT
jgi:hypothetical protein